MKFSDLHVINKFDLELIWGIKYQNNKYFLELDGFSKKTITLIWKDYLDLRIVEAIWLSPWSKVTLGLKD